MPSSYFTICIKIGTSNISLLHLYLTKLIYLHQRHRCFHSNTTVYTPFIDLGHYLKENCFYMFIRCFLAHLIHHGIQMCYCCHKLEIWSFFVAIRPLSTILRCHVISRSQSIINNQSSILEIQPLATKSASFAARPLTRSHVIILSGKRC